MKQTIYIAGPMSGKPDYNREAFNAAAEYLSEKLGLHPINPVDIERIYPCVNEDGKTEILRLAELLRIEKDFVRQADAIYLLKGWEYSEGARGELLAYLVSRPAERQVVFVQGCEAFDGGSASAAPAAEKSR